MDKWKCKYCKKQFETLFERDSHHRFHVEHYKMLFENCLGIIAELKAIIEEESLNPSLNNDFKKPCPTYKGGTVAPREFTPKDCPECDGTGFIKS